MVLKNAFLFHQQSKLLINPGLWSLLSSGIMDQGFRDHGIKIIWHLLGFIRVLKLLFYQFICYWNQLCVLDFVDTVSSNLGFPEKVVTTYFNNPGLQYYWTRTKRPVSNISYLRSISVFLFEMNLCFVKCSFIAGCTLQR